MRRKAFLTLTGLTTDQHRGMDRNGQLPFAELIGDGWGEYTGRHVLSTAISLALAPRCSDLDEAASRAAAFPSDHLTAAVRAVSDNPSQEIWAASFRVGAPFNWIVGDRGSVVDQLRLPTGAEPESIVFLNISRLASLIRDRATAAQIPLEVLGA